MTHSQIHQHLMRAFVPSNTIRKRAIHFKMATCRKRRCDRRVVATATQVV